MRYVLNVNGEARAVDAPPEKPLLAVLRDDLGLMGARFGCGEGICGACVVLADGEPIASCTTHVETAAGRAITTIEGLARGGELHPVQRAFVEEGAMQCGYCTSGMILAGAALLARNRAPSDAEIREALAPHLCRCGVYLRAAAAVKRAAR
jgi:aerobic-type carbon monoxide dehydrogenase small subunit (CoxS/CutS family)